MIGSFSEAVAAETSINAFRSRFSERRVHPRSSPSLRAENLALSSRGGRSVTADDIATMFFRAVRECAQTAFRDSSNHNIMPSQPTGPPTALAPTCAQSSMLRPILAPDRRARAAALSHPLLRSADRGAAFQPEFERGPALRTPSSVPYRRTN
jgi:hypothetical protein